MHLDFDHTSRQAPATGRGSEQGGRPAGMPMNSWEMLLRRRWEVPHPPCREGQAPRAGTRSNPPSPNMSLIPPPQLKSRGDDRFVRQGCRHDLVIVRGRFGLARTIRGHRVAYDCCGFGACRCSPGRSSP